MAPQTGPETTEAGGRKFRLGLVSGIEVSGSAFQQRSLLAV